ncbi:MAG: hypothetical protein ABS917_11180 [Solibacillus sp.]|uniref:hypothetical protein n=1 Tax=Solibacillus sp. TaxID=1909654 RepID=UPI003315D678
MLDTLMKHAKHFTDETGQDAADTKKVVHFHDCGSLFMADGIVGLFALKVHQEKDSTKTPSGAVSKEAPISHEKVINLLGAAASVQDSAIIKANIDVEALLKYTKAVIHACKYDSENEKKEDPLLNINLKVNKGLVYEQHGAELKSFYNDAEVSPAEDVIGATLNAKNLLKVLAVLHELGYDDVQLLITGRFRPVEIRSYDCAVRTIVMPIRTY